MSKYRYRTISFLSDYGLVDEFVGVCGFWQSPGWRRELTWWLLPRHRSRGFAQEASQAVVAHAYDVFGWESVETYMDIKGIPPASELFTNRFTGHVKLTDAEWSQVDQRVRGFLPAMRG